MAPGSPGILSNTASVEGDLVDPNTSNDSQTITTVIQSASPDANLALTITDSIDPLPVGSSTDYDLVITNNGPDVAIDDVQVTGAFTGGGMTINSITSASGPIVCQGAAIDCTIGILDIGASFTLTVNATPSVEETVTLTATAQTIGGNAVGDSDPPDNTNITEQTQVVAAGTIIWAFPCKWKLERSEPLGWGRRPSSRG